jgi:hypothetical protein
LVTVPATAGLNVIRLLLLAPVSFDNPAVTLDGVPSCPGRNPSRNAMMASAVVVAPVPSTLSAINCGPANWERYREINRPSVSGSAVPFPSTSKFTAGVAAGSTCGSASCTSAFSG